MTDQERNKANLQRLFDEVMNGHDVDAADGLITPDRPDHDPNLPAEFTRDREGFKLLFRMFIGAFPDLHFTTEFMMADGDMVASYGTVEGTQKGEFMGIAGHRQLIQGRQRRLLPVHPERADRRALGRHRHGVGDAAARRGGHALGSSRSAGVPARPCR